VVLWSNGDEMVHDTQTSRPTTDAESALIKIGKPDQAKGQEEFAAPVTGVQVNNLKGHQAKEWKMKMNGFLEYLAKTRKNLGVTVFDLNTHVCFGREQRRKRDAQLRITDKLYGISKEEVKSIGDDYRRREEELHGA
jgi:hypothetical protein